MPSVNFYNHQQSKIAMQIQFPAVSASANQSEKKMETIRKNKNQRVVNSTPFKGWEYFKNELEFE